MRVPIPSRSRRVAEKGLDWAFRTVPILAMVAIGALVAAQQAVSPHRRVVKLGVLLALLSFMFRFDMVYSVYLFALLFPFPSGISVGSTNYVLMTVIPLVWAVRSSATNVALITPTRADRAIILLLIAYVVSLFNVSSPYALTRSLSIIWGSVATFGLYYMVVNFVDTEAKLDRLCKVLCVSCAFVMSTAIIELLAPGSTLIPGWIGLTQNPMAGKLGYRLEGMRVGGAFSSHGMLADFGTQLIMFMVYFFVCARNPLMRLIWASTSAMTFVAIMATANRGSVAGLGLAVLLALAYFRRAIGFHRMVLVLSVLIAGFIGTQYVLREHTVAVSVADRFLDTEFEGIVPENRTMTWKPALVRGMEQPIIGHGPYYELSRGLDFVYWPHNGYIFYFYTLGLLGLSAFVWVMVSVYRESARWRHPGIRGTHAGNLLAIAQIWFLVQSFEQLRTDHQRDDIYPFIVWMCFGVVMAAARVARKQAGDPEAAQGPALVPGKRALTS